VGEPVPWRLQDEIEQSRLDLIKTDLDLCLTFATVADTAMSMGHREHAERTIAKHYPDSKYNVERKGRTIR
jgi:hypothetical protein